MIIKSVHVKKFRGFDDLSFQLGSAMTVIAGQNGTQKTTLLGMLTQPFSISNRSNPMFAEKPLTGGNYRSSFAEKFKLSDTFDKPKTHEWTLFFSHTNEQAFTVESIARSKRKAGVRFWKKGTRAKGSGYIDLPVIYLSLSRLFPIGEDNAIASSNNIKLSMLEFELYKRWHNKILIIPNGEMTSVDYLASRQKTTLGVNTSHYDWKMNSAGQDNIGKILLAILSFKRLGDKYGNLYQGGILAIDELDATLYPASQLKLLEIFRKFSSQYKIQIVFTTHSLTILKKVCEWQADTNILGQVRVLYLQRTDSKVEIVEKASYDTIRDNLNVAMGISQVKAKIPIFTEDEEGKTFFRALIKRRASTFEFFDCRLGCDELLELSIGKVPGFRYPESLIVLDGDVKKKTKKKNKIASAKNILLLPGGDSPERLIAKFLFDLSDTSCIWGMISPGYNKQFAFKNYAIDDIVVSRDDAKKWFKEQKQFWGKMCVKVINPWIKQNQSEVNCFIENLDKLVDDRSKRLLV